MTKPPITEQRRRNGLALFGSDARKIIAPILGNRGFVQADLTAHWTDILGTALAQGIVPYSIRFPKGKHQDAVLHVKAVSGAFAMAFSAQTPEILSRINTFFGYSAIAELRIVQGAPPPPAPKPKQPKPDAQKQQTAEALTADIDDDDLKQALIELGSFLPDIK